MKTLQLKNLFEQLMGTKKAIRFNSLMIKGFSSASILLAVKHVNAELCNDNEGYTIIKF